MDYREPSVYSIFGSANEWEVGKYPEIMVKLEQRILDPTLHCLVRVSGILVLESAVIPARWLVGRSSMPENSACSCISRSEFPGVVRPIGVLCKEEICMIYAFDVAVITVSQSIDMEQLKVHGTGSGGW